MAKVFRPQPGQIDFSQARWAPVINCVVRFRRKILLVQRSTSLRLYPGYWNGISGFLDDQASLKQKVDEELKEELGLPSNKIGKMKLGTIFHQDEPRYNKTWIVHPILVDVLTDQVQLDWEAEKYQWLVPNKALSLKLLPGFDRVLKTFLFDKRRFLC